MFHFLNVNKLPDLNGETNNTKKFCGKKFSLHHQCLSHFLPCLVVQLCNSFCDFLESAILLVNSAIKPLHDVKVSTYNVDGSCLVVWVYSMFFFSSTSCMMHLMLSGQRLK